MSYGPQYSPTDLVLSAYISKARERHTRRKKEGEETIQPLFPEFAAALAGRYRFALAADADAAAAAEARVLLVPGLAPVTAQHLARLPALELVLGTSAGVDHVDVREFFRS